MNYSENRPYALVFVYWLLLGFLSEGLAYFFSWHRFFNVVENLLFVALILFITGSIRSDRLRYWVCKVAIVMIVFMIWLETVMYLNFKIHFGPSSFFVLVNTNIDEIKEFVSEYVGFQTLIVSFLFFMPLVKLKSIAGYVSNKISEFQFKQYPILKASLIGLFVLITLRATKLIDHNLPYLVGRSVVLNQLDNKFIEDFDAQIAQNQNVSKNLLNDVKSTFVIVIGESATSAHMQLYDYYRETTPFLQQKKNSLNVYNDIISPNTSTFHSLSKALTLGNYEEPKKVLALPITTLFNKAGFKTFWISNHSPAFNPSSALARVSSQAKSSFFNSKTVVMNNRKHDGEILDEVYKALRDDAAHKIIFVHLIGSHFSYENRYPESFNVFKKTPKTQFGSELAYQKINDYDNAIRYSDYILNQILEETKKTGRHSYLMYFSDHGEEVFQDEEFYGHLEDRPTKNTFKIPLLMWYSNDFNYPEDFVFDQNRKYMTDDLWHSITHISGLESSFLDKSRSIFSNDFKNRQRQILGGKNYETVFP